METNWEGKCLIRMLPKLSKDVVNFQQESGIPNKVRPSQLPMQNKMRLDMNAFKFLSTIHICFWGSILGWLLVLVYVLTSIQAHFS